MPKKPIILSKDYIEDEDVWDYAVGSRNFQRIITLDEEDDDKAIEEYTRWRVSKRNLKKELKLAGVSSELKLAKEIQSCIYRIKRLNESEYHKLDYYYQIIEENASRIAAYFQSSVE